MKSYFSFQWYIFISGFSIINIEQNCISFGVLYEGHCWLFWIVFPTHHCFYFPDNYQGCKKLKNSFNLSSKVKANSCMHRNLRVFFVWFQSVLLYAQSPHSVYYSTLEFLILLSDFSETQFTNYGFWKVFLFSTFLVLHWTILFPLSLPAFLFSI